MEEDYTSVLILFRAISAVSIRKIRRRRLT